MAAGKRPLFPLPRCQVLNDDGLQCGMNYDHPSRHSFSPADQAPGNTSTGCRFCDMGMPLGPDPPAIWNEDPAAVLLHAVLHELLDINRKLGSVTP